MPANTAPAGYTCPNCKDPIFPAGNVASPVAEVLRKHLANANWAKAGLGMPLVLWFTDYRIFFNVLIYVRPCFLSLIRSRTQHRVWTQIQHIKYLSWNHLLIRRVNRALRRTRQLQWTCTTRTCQWRTVAARTCYKQLLLLRRVPLRPVLQLPQRTRVQTNLPISFKVNSLHTWTPTSL